MFDVGFSEILVIFVLALIVLGPEKLPRVASQVGRWIGRARGMARQFREQLEEEVSLEEARKQQQPSVPARYPERQVASSQTPSVYAEPPPVAQAGHEPVHPPTYSHAHATDSLGRPIAAPAPTPQAQPHSILPPTFTGEPAAPAQPEGSAQLPADPLDPAADSRQQDWVTNLTGDEQPRQPDATVAAYAPSHERGT